jgi:Pentapeptide repeats (8 copies)
MAGRFRPRRRGLVALSAAAGLLVVGWLATTPWLAEQWPRVLAVALFLFVFVVPRLFVPERSAASLTGVEDPAVRGRLEDDRLRLQNDVRIGLLQAVAGVAVIAAVVVTWQQLETDRRQLRQQLEVAGQEQAAERFARALDQLGSEQLDVRLGGIYGLERIAARASAAAASAGGAYRPPEGSGEPHEGPAGGGSGSSPAGGTEAAPESREGSGEPQGGAPERRAPDPSPGWWASQDRVQVFEILSAYVRTTSHRPPIGPADADSLQVRQADVNAAVTVLARRTVLHGDPALDLSGSVLPGARLGWARLAGADLRGADLRGTSLQHAQLAGVHLEQSLLCGTQFQGADLRGAHLAGARASADTRWPDGFDWRAAGARLVESC